MTGDADVLGEAELPDGLTAPPPDALAVFGDALGLASRYAALLAGPGVERGLIGPAEAPRLWERHLINCGVVAELVPKTVEGEPPSVIDLGSGAGLPGIVLAMLLPDVHFVLLEPMARRVAFLTECVAELELGNVDVHRARAQDAAGTLIADVVIARAVAPLDRLAGMALGLVRPGGMVLAIKGAGAADEIARSGSELRRLGATDVQLVAAGEGRVSEPAMVVQFTASRAASAAARQRRHLDGSSGAGYNGPRRSGPAKAGRQGRRRSSPG